jgi:hypothetical protein
MLGFLLALLTARRRTACARLLPPAATSYACARGRSQCGSIGARSS